MKQIALLALTLGAPTATLAQDAPFALIAWNGEAARATLTITELGAGRIAGRAPCNRYFGDAQTRGADLISIGPLAATRMACPDLATESAMLDALQKMTRIDRAGDTLVLSAGTGDAWMVFTARRD